MTTFYNDNEPYVAEWLKNLSAAGHISAGDVSGESILDIESWQLVGYERCHFFAGIGGWDYALQLAGWPEDLPVWTGSCPCQPFSVAGKRKGTADERHLWPYFREFIRQCKPPIIFGEQVASKDGRLWLAGVRADLEALGYAVGAADLCAAGVGAPHIRQRLYWMAHTKHNGWWADESGRQSKGRIADGRMALAECYSSEPGRFTNESRESLGAQTSRASDELGRRGDVSGYWNPSELIPCLDGKARRIEPGTFPLAHGVPARVGKLRAYGNAIVPQVAAEFIRSVMDILNV